MTELKTNAHLMQTAVKCRFFAQYWGVKCFQWKPENSIGLQIDKVNSQIEKYYNCGFLLLKPLSKATREELLDTYHKMWEFNEDLIESDIKLAIDWFNNYGTQNYVKFNQQQTDFLRSKGYAIPFMEYSVNDLVSFGWVRLL